MRDGKREGKYYRGKSGGKYYKKGEKE